MKLTHLDEKDRPNLTFRDNASFGKRMEYYFTGLMLKEGLDCYLPIVDDDGIDVIIRKKDGSYIEIQIKARSKQVVEGNGALFAAITHEPRKNYYFLFYSQRLNIMLVMSSEEFLKECATNKSGKNKGKHSIWFNGYKTNKETGEKKEYIYLHFEKYIVSDFSRFE